jgi:uncharacterized tellurite resistance protein B-like protein
MSNFELTQDDITKLNDDQKSAVFDSLVCAAWADDNVSVAETQLFEKEVGRLNWGKSQAEQLAMIDASKGRLAALKDRDSVVRFIKDLGTRITDQGLRERVLYTMTRIMVTDSKLDLPEQNIIGAFMATFGISKERFQTMVREAVNA